MPAVSGSARSRLAASQPSSLGIMMSSVMTSGRDVLDLVQAVLPVDGRRHLEALELEVDGDELTDHVVVVHDEDATQAARHGADATQPAAARSHGSRARGPAGSVLDRPEPP